MGRVGFTLRPYILSSLFCFFGISASLTVSRRLLCSEDSMVTRWSEKSPGLKILWIWTLGTAGILITSVMRTRLHDMERILKEEEEDAARPDSDGLLAANRDEILREE